MPVFSARTAGIYRARYIGCVEKPFTNKDTGEDEPRFVWKFQETADTTTAGQIDKITGTSMVSPNSNAYKMAAGIVGRPLQPGDDTEAYVGRLYDVVYGPNQAGNLTITAVMPVAETPQQVVAAITAAVSPVETALASPETAQEASQPAELP